MTLSKQQTELVLFLRRQLNCEMSLSAAINLYLEYHCLTPSEFEEIILPIVASLWNSAER
jgi:hypothetical protein